MPGKCRWILRLRSGEPPHYRERFVGSIVLCREKDNIKSTLLVLLHGSVLASFSGWMNPKPQTLNPKMRALI